MPNNQAYLLLSQESKQHLPPKPSGLRYSSSFSQTRTNLIKKKRRLHSRIPLLACLPTMSDKNDQAPNSPSQKSTGLPFKKRDFAEKTLPVLKGAAETMPSDSNYDDFFRKEMTLDDLRKQAYYDVLQAFAAENYEISTPRTTIITDLKEEWKISNQTHNAFADKLTLDPLIQQLRKNSLASDKSEKQKVAATVKGNPLNFRLKLNKKDLIKFERLNAAPAKMQKEKAKANYTSDDSPILGWGPVSPASLVNKWISIRLPGENDYVAYLIKDYDAKTEMHHLVTALSKKDFVDPCDWIDLRHFPAEDIVWQEGHPGFPTRECFLKPGETILHVTTTARQKKPLKEVGKTASGIPIIRKLDKGKSVA